MKVIIITPSGNWGNSIAQTFQQHWQELGGQIVVELDYYNHSGLAHNIRELLNIDQAYSRQKQLRKTLHKKVRFLPRRRQDFDAIFLAATPSVGRQIIPLLKFYFAGNVPIYSISTIYGGRENSHANNDLNGVLFEDMPWLLYNDHQITPSLKLLRNHIKEIWPSSYAKYPRLYAMGIDAYNLIPNLTKLTLIPNFSMLGSTGQLWLLPNHKIQRKLTWSKITKGHPI